MNVVSSSPRTSPKFAPFDALPTTPDVLSEVEFEKVRNLVEAELGIRFPSSKRAMMEARLGRRWRELGLPSAKAYWQRLFGATSDPEEVQHLLDTATTNVTHFFREPVQLEVTRPELRRLISDASQSDRTLRVWSAACSSGEEVWTLGMMAIEEAEAIRTRVNIELSGTDVSMRVLERAVEGIYTTDDLDRVPAPLQARWFMRSRHEGDARVRIAPDLRECASFMHMNLIAPPYPVAREQDLVFLRNVLIYFDREKQQRIVANVVSHLRVGGTLAVSLTESLHGFDVPLVHLGNSLYRKERGR